MTTHTHTHKTRLWSFHRDDAGWIGCVKGYEDWYYVLGHAGFWFVGRRDFVKGFPLYRLSDACDLVIHLNSEEEKEREA